MLQIVIYKKLNFWEEYTPLGQNMINLIICRTHEKNKIKNHTTHQFFFGAFIKVVPAALLKAQISIWSIKNDWK